MGLLDVLNGMQHGPRGGDRSASPSTGSGGMSPMTMAILGLLAYKALKHFTGQQQTAAPGGALHAEHHRAAAGRRARRPARWRRPAGLPAAC